MGLDRVEAADEPVAERHSPKSVLQTWALTFNNVRTASRILHFPELVSHSFIVFTATFASEGKE